jgi:hypothetical protein
MNTTVMMKRIAVASPRFKARIAGVLYFFSLLTAEFGEFVRGRLGFAAGYIAVAGMVAGYPRGVGPPGVSIPASAV